nr:hypothetical protein [Tanacetum cinerariifolium]
MHVVVLSESFLKKQNRSGEWAVANKIKIRALKKTDVGNWKRASSRSALVDEAFKAITEHKNYTILMPTPTTIKSMQLLGEIPSLVGAAAKV